MSRKTKRNETKGVELLEDTTPKISKSMLMLYRITIMVLGIIAITVICAILAHSMFPENRSVWPALTTLAFWAAWIIYVFKFMKIKGADDR